MIGYQLTHILRLLADMCRIIPLLIKALQKGGNGRKGLCGKALKLLHFQNGKIDNAIIFLLIINGRIIVFRFDPCMVFSKAAKSRSLFSNVVS